ncbi:MAG: T9SS type A sorting domain-containing protein [Pricia sp.]
MKFSIPQNSVLSGVVATSCQIREITGDNCVCSTGTITLTVANLAAGIAPVWTTSSNIVRVATNNNSVTIRGQSGSRSQGTVTATWNGITLTKQVWVGEPNAPLTLSGPSTVNTGALVNYSSSDAPGATSYEWRLPYPFDVVSQFNYSGQKWQMRQTTTKYLQAFTGYAKTSGLVQVWGKNKCGNGGAKTMSVSHRTSGGGPGGGGIPLIANLSQFNEPLSNQDIYYPNPTNTDLNIYIANRDSYTHLFTTLLTMDGKIVYSSADKTISSIPTSSLANGNYILSIKTDKGAKTERIIIRH